MCCLLNRHGTARHLIHHYQLHVVGQLGPRVDGRDRLFDQFLRMSFVSRGTEVSLEGDNLGSTYVICVNALIIRRAIVDIVEHSILHAPITKRDDSRLVTRRL